MDRRMCRNRTRMRMVLVRTYASSDSLPPSWAWAQCADELIDATVRKGPCCFSSAKFSKAVDVGHARIAGVSMVVCIPWGIVVGLRGCFLNPHHPGSHDHSPLGKSTQGLVHFVAKFWSLCADASAVCRWDRAACCQVVTGSDRAQERTARSLFCTRMHACIHA